MMFSHTSDTSISNSKEFNRKIPKHYPKIYLFSIISAKVSMYICNVPGNLLWVSDIDAKNCEYMEFPKFPGNLENNTRPLRFQNGRIYNTTCNEMMIGELIII